MKRFCSGFCTVLIAFGLALPMLGVTPAAPRFLRAACTAAVNAEDQPNILTYCTKEAEAYAIMAAYAAGDDEAFYLGMEASDLAIVGEAQHLLGDPGAGDLLFHQARYLLNQAYHLAQSDNTIELLNHTSASLEEEGY